MKAGLPVQSQTQISQIIAQSIASIVKPPEGPKEAVEPEPPAADVAEAESKPLGACPSCGMELAQFRNTGLLGCPECYRAFESVLAPLIERAHEGSTHHTGKSPRMGTTVCGVAGASVASGGAGASGGNEKMLKAFRAERGKRLEVLKRQLAESVSGEQYEKAARLRDEITRIEREVQAMDTTALSSPGPAENAGEQA